MPNDVLAKTDWHCFQPPRFDAKIVLLNHTNVWYNSTHERTGSALLLSNPSGYSHLPLRFITCEAASPSSFTGNGNVRRIRAPGCEQAHRSGACCLRTRREPNILFSQPQASPSSRASGTRDPHHRTLRNSPGTSPLSRHPICICVRLDKRRKRDIVQRHRSDGDRSARPAQVGIANVVGITENRTGGQRPRNDPRRLSIPMRRT